MRQIQQRPGLHGALDGGLLGRLPRLAVPLNVLEDDGLLELSDAGISITPSGRLLLRNIAMTFDRYIDLEENDNRFSKAI